MVEGSEFELPVPICEQSDDSFRLSFANRANGKTLSRCSAFLVSWNRSAIGSERPLFQGILAFFVYQSEIDTRRNR
jgi:hypothetical protein